MDPIYVGLSIEKVEKQADGTVFVWGPCTTDDLDSDRQIIDPEFAAKGLGDWLRTGGNVRQMHQSIAVGKGVELVREGGKHYLKSHVIDTNCVNLVTNKVLTAYSVGISNAQLDFTTVKARGGRIVGGEFVEVSLVDRPANAACKVDLVEKNADGSAQFTEVVLGKADTVDCPTCKGSGKIMEGHRKCPDCEGAGKLPATKVQDGKVVKRACGVPACEVCAQYVAKGTLSTAARNDLNDSDFAYVDSQGGRHLPVHDEGHVRSALGRFNQQAFESDAAKKAAAKKILARAKSMGITVDDSSNVAQAAKAKGKVPPVDQAVTSALDDADKDVHAARTAQAADNAAHQSGNDDTDEDSDKAAVPLVVKRLHDACCACYSEASVLEAHRTISTLAEVFTVNYWQDRTTKAFAEGPAAATPVLAMYSLVNDLAQLTPDEVSACHTELHKAFADMYPNVHLSPTAIAPGQFKRPFISGGRAGLKPSGKPKMPPGARTLSPSDFDRRYISTGRQANSPMAGPPNGATKAEVVGNVVRVTHEPTGVAFDGPDEKTAYKAVRKVLSNQGVSIPTWKQRQFYTNNAKDQSTQAMQTLHDYIAATHPEICSMKNDDDEAPEVNAKTMDNNADAMPHPETMPSTKTKTLVKMLARAEKGRDKAERKLAKALSELKKERSQPVAETTYRGPAEMARRVVPFTPKTTKPDTEGPAAQAEVEKAREVEWLKGELKHGTPEGRAMALTKLQDILPPEELAATLVTA